MGISVTKTGPYFASGEIKFSQLRANFKETSSGSVSASELFRNLNLYDRDPVTPDSTENDQIASDPFPSDGSSGSFNVTYGPQYSVSPVYRVTKDLTAGDYATVFTGTSVSPVNRVRQTGFSGGNYNTVYGPAYSVSPVNRVKLQNGTYTFTYESYDVGTNTSSTLEGSGGGVRYSIGALITDTGISQIYEIQVEELLGGGGGTYEYVYDSTVIASSTATQITDSTRRYTVGTLVSNTVNSRTYEIKVEERSGLYTFTENNVDVGTSAQSQITLSGGNKRYSIGAIVVNNAPISEVYEIKIEEFVANNFTTGPFVFSGTGTNWKTSQFRNSIKRYKATQSGTDQFLDMGLKSGSGGIDWDGTSNLDVSGVGGNYQRNVQKIIDITGICYSDDTGTNGAVGGGGRGNAKKAAAKIVLANPLKVINARIHIKSGAGIYGAGGLGGYFPDGHSPELDCDPGKDGGPGLSVSHEGIESPTYIHMDGGNLYGGGGGGEQGQQGAWPVATGLCDPGGYYESYGGETTCTTGGGYVAGYDEGCHGSGSGGSCGPGEISASLYIASFPCPDGSGYGTISATFCYTQTCVTTPSGSNYVSYGPTYPTTLPEQGRGGRGGDGAGGASGYGYYQPRTDGQSGTADVKASCSNGAVPRNMRNSDYGGEGSNGGNWGAVGGSNLGVSPAATGLTQGQGGGRGGSSICGKYYLLQPGYDTAPYIYGPTKLQCDGTESPEIPVGNLPSVTVNPTSYVRFNYGELDGTATQTLNVTGTIQVEIQRQIMERLDGGSNSGSIDGWGVRGIRIKRPDGSILWENIINNKRQSEYPNGFTAPESSPQTPFYQSTGLITLTQGVYPVEFIELNAANKAGTDSNGFDYLLAGRILEMGQKLIFRDGSDIDRNQVIRLKSAGTSNQWVRSYDSNKHDTLKADGTYEFVAMHYYWSQFMRDHAVWENNDDPKTQNGSEPSFENAWSFNPGVDRSTSHPDGGLRLRAQSDNDCQFFMDQSFPFAETEKYCTAGSLCHSGNDVLDVEIPYGFSDGLVVSMRVVCHNRQPLSITWNTINAPGYVAGQNYVLFTTATQQYPRGTFEYYWGGVKVGTLDIEGSSITYIESEDGNYRYDSHTQVDPNQNFYTISRLERDPLMNWAENPAGVAFKIYYKERVTQPDGSFIYQDKDVLYSSNLEQAEGSLWGSASITYTASGVNITDPVQGIDGFSSPPDAAYDIPNKLTVGSDEVRARPIRPTTYTVRARNRVGNATDSTNIL